jgi:hypothetical protein
MERLTRAILAGNAGCFARAGLSIHREGQSWVWLGLQRVLLIGFRNRSMVLSD